MIFAFVFIMLAIVAPITGYLLARHLFDGDWDNHQQHKCGHVQRYGRVCEKCGGTDGFKPVIARAKLPFVWEIKS